MGKGVHRLNDHRQLDTSIYYSSKNSLYILRFCFPKELLCNEIIYEATYKSLVTTHMIKGSCFCFKMKLLLCHIFKDKNNSLSSLQLLLVLVYQLASTLQHTT